MDISRFSDRQLMVKDSFKSHLIFKIDLIGPFIPKWMCIPHKCLFSRLVEVQDCKLKGWLSFECFDEWMSLNGGNYQLGKGGKLHHLWDERMDGFECINLDIQDDIISMLEIDTKYFRIVKCNIHAFKHIDINNSLKSVNNNSLRRDDFKVFNKLFPFYDDTDKKHVNLDLATLVYNVWKVNKIEVLRSWLMICPIGMNNSTATSLLIHKLGNDNANKIWKLMEHDKACCMANGTYKTYFKAISIAIRRTSMWDNGEPATLAEITACSSWELALGRHGMKSDWEQEHTNRIKTFLPLKLPLDDIANSATNDKFVCYAEPIMTEIVRQMMPEKEIWDTWERFCLNRNSWLSSGSAGAKFTVLEGEKIRLNKRSYMETVPISDMVKWLDGEPKIVAIASEKYEMGKARAIYGTKIEDQCIMAYLLNVLEPRLYYIDDIECGLTGRSEVLSILRRCNIAAREGEECTMLDYSDFNLQHTLPMQSLVFKCIKNELIREGCEADAIRVAQWCEDALLDQRVKFPGCDKYEMVIQGLFSGNRGTNFINTLLNKLYFQVALKWVEDNLSLVPERMFILHHGDDVWLSNKSRLWAITIYKVLEMCGLIFSDKKQIQDVNMGEFLRVVYNAEGARGYLARSLATLIERPLQSELDIAPTVKAVGTNSQVNTCYRRGLSMEASHIIWDCVVPFALKSEIKDISRITVPIGLVCRSFSENGLDIGKPCSLPSKCGSIPKIPTMMFHSNALEGHIPKHTTDAFVQVLSEEVQEEINADSIRRALHELNVADSIPQGDKIRSLLRFHQDIKKWKSKCDRMKAKTCNRKVVDLNEFIDDNVDNDFIEDLENLEKSWAIEKISDISKNKIDMILYAIAQSPYKDIVTAQRAKHLNIIEATVLCIRTSRKHELRVQAMEVLSYLRASTSDEIVTRMLCALKGFGPSMESWFNPVSLSYITNYAINLAINVATFKGLKSVEKWEKILNNSLKLHFATAMKQGLLIEISKY